MEQHYLLPPVVAGPDGEPRKVGFEFEFGNLPILRTAEALQHALGGDLEVKTPFEAILSNSSLGRLKIERDANLLKSVRYRKWLEQLGVEFQPGSLGHEIETNIDNASRGLIPCEVVTAPIALSDLGTLDTLVSTLNTLGAEGTQDSLIYAFGLHINPSLPAADANTLLRYLQAFMLLFAWIIAATDIDLTRRYLTKYIDPFPREYMSLILDQHYAPDMDDFIDDYMAHNATRNRALDMLPILRHLDEARVIQALPDDEHALVKARPAFHYRLPDCKINLPGWSVAAAWNHWVFIEKLAADKALLNELIGAWRASNDKFSLAPNSAWALSLTSLLSQKYFAQK